MPSHPQEWNPNDLIETFSGIVRTTCVGMPSTEEGINATVEDMLFISEFIRQQSKILLSRRNALSPISQLPREVLVYIFNMCSPTAYYFEGPDREAETNVPSQFEYPMTIFAFSQVCTSWRDVALSTPALWATPIFDWSSVDAVAREMTRRTAQYPLIVAARLNYQNLKPVRSTLSAHSSRVRHIVLEGTHRRMVKVLAVLNSKPANLLEKLSLELDEMSKLDEDMEPYSINSTIFSREAPRLRDLELKNCTIHWDSPLLSNLTRLLIDLEGIIDGMDFRAVTEILKHTPLLEYLNLREVYDPLRNFSDFIEPAEQSIALSFIDELVFEDDSPFMLPMLRQLTLPSGARVQLSSGQRDWSSPETLEALYRHLARRYSAREPLGALKIFADILGVMNVHEHIGDMDGTDKDFSQDTRRLDLRMPLQRSEGRDFALQFTLVVTSLPVKHLMTFCLICYDASKMITRTDIERVFSQLSNLRRLEAGYAVIPPVVEALLVSGQSSAGVYLPSLATLILRSPQLRNRRETIDNKAGDEVNSLDVGDLNSLLHLRHVAGHNLDKLVLLDCTHPNREDTFGEDIRSYVSQHVQGRDTHVEVCISALEY